MPAATLPQQTLDAFHALTEPDHSPGHFVVSPLSMFFHFVKTRPSSHSTATALKTIPRMKSSDCNSFHALTRVLVRTKPSSLNQMTALHAAQEVSGNRPTAPPSSTRAVPHGQRMDIEKFI